VPLDDGDLRLTEDAVYSWSGPEVWKAGCGPETSVCSRLAIIPDFQPARKLPRQGDTSKGELLASDVSPVTRQFLTRADDLFGGPDSLTLCDELIRGQVPE
jgi:hypothetical protein